MAGVPPVPAEEIGTETSVSCIGISQIKNIEVVNDQMIFSICGAIRHGKTGFHLLSEAPELMGDTLMRLPLTSYAAQTS
jgi:hypothetical protein